MDDLDRMYRLLVRNARNVAPDYLARPFELAELYQNLIPYRHHRRELGIETNEDYELALTRLIAGERGYLVTEPEVQESLRRVLGSTNPEPSAFRQFAHSQIAFAPEALRHLATGDGAPSHGAAAPTYAPAPAPPQVPPPPPPAPAHSYAPPAPAPAPMPVRGTPSGAAAGIAAGAAAAAMAAAPLPPAPMPAAPPPAPHSPAAPPMPSQPPRPSAASAAPPPLDTPVAGRAPLTVEAHGPCRYCGGTLPDGRRITFCPHCGQNLTLQHCPACGTELELGWKFCVTCGRASG
jgi:hypothetical protein